MYYKTHQQFSYETEAVATVQTRTNLKRQLIDRITCAFISHKLRLNYETTEFLETDF